MSFSKGNIGENMVKKTQTSDWVKISGYAFLLGVIIAVVAGLLGASVIPYTGTILVILGAIVGLLTAMGMGSISKADADTFLLAAIALVAVGAAGGALSDIPTIGPFLASIVGYIAIFVSPAVVIIALEAIWRAGSIKY